MRAIVSLAAGSSLLYASALAGSELRAEQDGPPGYSNSSSAAWDLKKFTSLVVFGDSYSDDSRLGYFIEHNGSAPPVGWVDPVVSLWLTIYNF